MASKYVIGDNGLPIGEAGTIARIVDAIVHNRVNGEATLSINFGDLVALNANNTYELLTASNTFKGVAVYNLKPNLALDQTVGAYAPGEFTDVIERGSVLVKFDGGTPTAGGPAYFKIVDGRAVVTADSAGGTALTDVVFTTGYSDGSGVIEITINTRR